MFHYLKWNVKSPGIIPISQSNAPNIDQDFFFKWKQHLHTTFNVYITLFFSRCRVRSGIIVQLVRRHPPQAQIEGWSRHWSVYSHFWWHHFRVGLIFLIVHMEQISNQHQSIQWQFQPATCTIRLLIPALEFCFTHPNSITYQIPVLNVY